MMITMMRWMCLLTVFASHLQIATLEDNGTTTPTEVVPASEYYVELQTEVVANYTEVVDVTTEFDDVVDVVDGATSDAPVPTTVVHVDQSGNNASLLENKTLILEPVKDVENTDGDYAGISTEVETSHNKTSAEDTGKLLTVEPSEITLQTEIYTVYATDTNELQSQQQEQLLSTRLESVNSTFPSLSSMEPTSETLVESSTGNSLNAAPNLSTTGAVGSINATGDLGDSLLTSKTNSSSYGAATNTTIITSTSTVPQDSLQTKPFSSTTTYLRETPAVTTSTDPSEDKLPATFTKEYGVRATSDLPVRHATPDFIKATKSTASTHPVTEEVTLTVGIGEEIGDEEYGDSVETEYERSLRTRRVINHAALWITIGFVVVLVSYITALVIYNRTRPDWQDSPRPYSRFENEPEDLPEFDENNMEYENHDVPGDYSQDENRRDFSQCVDPRDFPGCNGSNEYLLYEDPTYLDQATCTDFTYHDEC